MVKRMEDEWQVKLAEPRAARLGKRGVRSVPVPVKARHLSQESGYLTGWNSTRYQASPVTSQMANRPPWSDQCCQLFAHNAS